MTISKSEMLAKIVESGDKVFKIRFVKASGKDAGHITEKTCYYGAPNPYPRGDEAKTKKVGTRKTHLESNTIPLTEFGSGKMITPFISHIISFNDRQVIH